VLALADGPVDEASARFRPPPCVKRRMSSGSCRTSNWLFYRPGQGTDCLVRRSVRPRAEGPASSCWLPGRPNAASGADTDAESGLVAWSDLPCWSKAAWV